MPCVGCHAYPHALMAGKRNLTAKPAAPDKVPQSHGGALNAGGTVGHRGAGGRPRDAVRAVMLEGLNAALPRLIELSKDPDPSIAIKAADMLAKYGLGTSNQLDTTVRDKRVLTRSEREAKVLTLIKGGKTG